MNKSCLSMALLIAASLTPVSGCGAATADRSARQTLPDTSNRAVESEGADSGQALPVDSESARPSALDGPDKADGSDKPAPPSLADQLDALRQQVKAEQKNAEQRLAKQAQRLDTLQKTVEQLKTGLRRLPEPSAPANAARAPESAAGESPDTTGDQTTAPSGASAGADEDNDDEPAAPGDMPAALSPRAKSAVTARQGSSAGACPADRPLADQFDVFFSGATQEARTQAMRKIKAANMTDWFASGNGIYVGRYGTCPLAVHRRDDVHERTGLALKIAGVASRPTSAQRGSGHDYGRDDNLSGTRPRQSSRSPTQTLESAPFTIVGVEMRGTHRTLGVAAASARRLSDITWLSPGQTFQSWRLVEIQPDNDTATFTVDGRRVTVALPSRG